ncbi:hypothetical protein ACFQ5N_02255 [Lutibacter holmesii]|uniref:Uncharacterized protein n=1 Tax=Lutibacter holmesii TaxID=1137985 RepID=A0ABW3WL90_9FLAO
MKTKTQIENKLVDLYFKLEQLIEDETHGWSNNTPDKEALKNEIKGLEWVLD